jgi:hypothetical protein
MFIVCVCRRLEAEAGEKLEGVYHQLMQAGVDRNESERETRLKDSLVNLQRIFPSWYSHPYAYSLYNVINGLVFCMERRCPRTGGRSLSDLSMEVRD